MKKIWWRLFYWPTHVEIYGFCLYGWAGNATWVSEEASGKDYLYLLGGFYLHVN